MASVGLLYVGAVLLINGLMLLGLIPGKSAAPLNFFVGGMQVIFPTVILIQAEGDPAVTFAAAGLYLFGFTYLYVGLTQVTGVGPEGLGWFSLFVAVSAVVIGTLQFTLVSDPVFGVIWYLWAVLWLLFFLVLALGREPLTRVTGWFAAIGGQLTATLPAFLLLTGAYVSNAGTAAAMALAGTAALALSFYLGRQPAPQIKGQDEDPARPVPGFAVSPAVP
ncbi:transporter [Arthrobacter sp. Sa2CUA1]|uniref:Transporter n=1 Tax=Arthrobacter gallicola TaxID=2762225 RepID=A0ABR8UUC3_9MICC|nr:AmiS/UreI family transporter [Arthrobacter gallicola]MBD7995826.1 transporter [Arthrobacter gallicola]